MAGVIRTRQRNNSLPVGYGYVIIPKNVNRDDYLRTVFRKERVTILGEDSTGIFKECPISKIALQQINFPEDDSTLGSFVCYVSEPFKNKPTIIGVIAKESESQLLEEGEFQLKKELGNNSVEILGSAKESTLNINVNDLEDGGVLNINVVGKSSGKVNIKASTDVNIDCDNDVNVNTFNNISLKVDNVDNETETSLKLSKDGNVAFSGKVFDIFSGNDNAVGYSELKSGFDQLVTDFNNLVTLYNTHVHVSAAPGTPNSPTTSQGASSQADISASKKDGVKLP